ncbi:MAG TPA: FUSC family protein, partial [Candidatus Bathyarchaeia archaeon]|nr:FUSC family protein [Candidatus Bathyarchaeia archaeon]
MIEFLKAELAPTPGRAVATARIVIAALFGATIAVGFHMPHGHWIMITVFTVSQSDAGSTLRKGIQRIVGTVAGGLLALLGIIAFADQPWFLVPFVALGSALALFLSRTTSAPYVGLLAGLTFLILLPDVTDPALAVDTALARMFVIALGTVIGTAAQLWLWPSDPEDLLLDDLTTRLGTIDAILARVLAGAEAVPSPLEPLAASGLARELDLLGNSEARHASLRPKHLLQAAVIIEVDRLLTASLWLERVARGVELDASLRARLAAVRSRSLEVRRVLAERRQERRVA